MAYAACLILLHKSLFILMLTAYCSANDILGCGGFVKSHVKLDYSEIEIGLYTKEGSLKEKTECAPTNGYYFLPLYEKGDYVLKVHPPAGLSFEPSEVALYVDGVTDKCSTGQDINFAFNGFGINGRVITLGQKIGPSGISVQLVSEKGDTRNTETTVGGDFHFTAVIPGKYSVKASHPRWKLEPSHAEVQMKEGKMALPLGVVLAVKGYDVKGSVTSFGSPIHGVYVLLYSKEDNPKYRVEGCNTALLQAVPDSPICHVITDAQGEFTFGLVPAGEYHLVALRTTPGQVEVSYNVKPDVVPFTVRHDSLYIKNAFEVTGFTVVGSVVSSPGKGMSGVRVLLDGSPVGNSDALGKFTLQSLQPGVYTVSFQHEQCKVEDIQVAVSSSGVRGGVIGRVARWRVCGAVTPRARHVHLLREGQAAQATLIDILDSGKWCTFLTPGVYTAKVEVSEQEQREGLQFYPLTQKISVGHGAVEGISFSQLKGRLSGSVECGGGTCADVRVTLRPLSPDGGYVGTPVDTTVIDGKYTFTEVLPGSVEVSVSSPSLCWAESRHNVAVTQAEATVPPFRHSGYLLNLHSSHPVEVEYKSESSSGVFKLPRGASSQCVQRAGRYALTPRGCHKFEPPHASVECGPTRSNPVYLVAVAHTQGVKVTSPVAVDDLVLIVDRKGEVSERVGPLKPARDGGMFTFEHTLYMPEGEVAVITASSQSLLFHPGDLTQLVGGSECNSDALVFRARLALTLEGRILPPVEDVTVTLTSDDGVVSTQISSDGTYRFGPLDASHAYSVSMSKESYVFSAADAAGDVLATKLAEIHVQLLDEDGIPLQGALVSVSGGTYRRSALQTESALRFTSLSPAEYYVKPNMKEYKFTPPHALLTVLEGNTHTLTMKGIRVAWSCIGTLVSLGGQGWAGAVLAAVPSAGPQHCAIEEATTEASGAFRIRGLLPDCEYNIHLKESTIAELAGLRLARKPNTLKIVEKRDVTGVSIIGVQGGMVTDAHVLVRADNVEHYRTLRLALRPLHAHHLYSTRLQAPPHSPHSPLQNPGVMHVLPRLPADNNTYEVSLESSLSRSTHSYRDITYLFTSDGRFKYISFEFAPEVKSSDQELRQSSFLLIPLLGFLAFLYTIRERILAALPRPRAIRPPRPAVRPDVLDKASIHHILNTVNATGKKTTKSKKVQ